MIYKPLVKIKDRADSSTDYPPKQHSPLFCVPGTGGVSLCFHNLANQLSEIGYPVYGFDAPGLLSGTKPLHTVEEMASLYLTAMLRECASNSYNLLGYCFGALVILEMARNLKVNGYQVRLILIDPTTKAGVNSRLLYRQRPTKSAVALDLPPEYWQVESAAMDALNRYHPKPVAVDTLFVTRYDNLLGFDKWYHLTGGKLSEQVMACHHLQILNQPHVQAIARWIDEYLTGNK